MFTDGQGIERNEVEPWVAQAFPSHPFFKAQVREAPDKDHPERIRVTVTICDPGGTPLFVPVEQRRLIVNPNAVNSGTVAYHSLREAPVRMPQIEGGWAA